jgi:hypothetical protein
MKGFLDIETAVSPLQKMEYVKLHLRLIIKNEFCNIPYIDKPYTREEGSDELVSYKEDAMAVKPYS